jgi:hypothetical protein
VIPSSRLRLTLDIDNLFDETHCMSSVAPQWVTPDAARTVVLGAQIRF